MTNSASSQPATRDICVCLEWLTPQHKEQIRSTALPLGFTPHFFDLTEQDAARECLQHSEIYYGHTPALLRSAPATLQWYCCSFAGVEPYCKDPTFFANPNCLLTNSNSYGVTIAEHVMMTALMLLRQYPQYQQLITQREWANRLPFRAMRDTTFTLLGTGDIGQLTAQRLRAMEVRGIVGLNRSGRAPAGDLFDEVLPISQLDEVLPRTEVLIMSLPSTPQTAGIMDARRIALLPKGAFLINVGRGNALDQDALVAALRSGALGGAALDVVEPEPLPQDHDLWEAPNLILTPHVAGNMIPGHTRDANVAMFCEDLGNYAAGRPLAHLVDRSRGY